LGRRLLSHRIEKREFVLDEIESEEWILYLRIVSFSDPNSYDIQIQISKTAPCSTFFNLKKSKLNVEF